MKSRYLAAALAGSVACSPTLVTGATVPFVEHGPLIEVPPKVTPTGGAVPEAHEEKPWFTGRLYTSPHYHFGLRPAVSGGQAGFDGYGFTFQLSTDRVP